MNILQEMIDEVRPYYENQDNGHDWSHIKRVLKTLDLMAQKNEGNAEILNYSGLLHDIVNIPKNHPDRKRASELASMKAEKLLQKYQVDSKIISQVSLAILEHSYSKGSTPSSPEAACLQDADRLDAIGAIGILRCASVAQKMNALYYHVDDPWAQNRKRDDSKFMLDHYFEKLLKLPHLMNTKTGIKLAKSRVKFMEIFLKQLRGEIDL
jgi:uncharacterized protein